MMKSKFALFFLLFMAISGHAQTVVKHCVSCEVNCKCPYDVELSDSLQLMHIKNQFYKNASGHIYEKTFSANPHRERTYFNGLLPQEVDPMTFKVIKDSWYARDKNYIYLYRPMSGGMWIARLEKADYATFRPLSEGSWQAMDKYRFYDMGTEIDGFDPKTTKIIRDKNGSAIKLVDGKKVHKIN